MRNNVDVALEMSTRFSHQSSCFVVDQFKLFIQCNLLYTEGHARKAQLPCDIHAAHFHIHSYNLHGTNTPGRWKVIIEQMFIRE